ncbi:MAG: excinuclease ABC subunit A [Spongiibacteraceae bacterium]
MKGIVVIVLANILLVMGASARDDVGSYSIDEALSLEQSKEVLGTEVRFYFGDQSHGKVTKRYGEYTSNKKTNAFNKSDKEACQWVFLSAMKALKDRALREGGNAVINIKSNYKRRTSSSSDTFDCGAGAVMAGVTMVGTVVTIN